MADTVLSAVLAATLGGLLAIAGGLSATWFQSRTTRRIRMNQIIAERKVAANADAYKYLKLIEGHLAEHSETEALTLMTGQEDWLFANRLFLPAGFPDVWLLLRTNLKWLSGDPLEVPHDPENLHRLRLQALKLVKEAVHQVYRDMDMEADGREYKTPA